VDTGNHCDNCVTTVRLPFPVQLYDQSFSQVTVGSNGTIGFTANGNPATNTCLPNATFNYGLLPYWDDLTTAGTNGEGIYTSVSGQTPNRMLHIEWRARRVADGANMHFEVRLLERQNTINIVYGEIDTTGQSATIGLQKGTGSAYQQLLCQVQPGASAAGGEIEPVPGLMVNLVMQSGPEPTPTACAIGFSDVPPGHTFYDFVRCLACRGVVGGYGDGTFQPGNNVSRGQIAKMVANAIGLNDEPGEQVFEDVPPGSTFYDFVQRLALRGYMSGYACGGVGEPCVAPGNRPYFRPAGNATRGQIAKIVSNAASFEGEPTGQTFEDMAPGNTFYLEVERLASREIVGGYPCGGPGEPCGSENLPYFRPASTVTRGQTAKIVANTFFPDCQTP
jgi:hypothetical protein